MFRQRGWKRFTEFYAGPPTNAQHQTTTLTFTDSGGLHLLALLCRCVNLVDYSYEPVFDALHSSPTALASLGASHTPITASTGGLNRIRSYLPAPREDRQTFFCNCSAHDGDNLQVSDATKAAFVTARWE
ncbi:hypothetical protein LshimejAT787_0800970 [Lyophyllum shimeji]|uniref:Uncharacterized protein n=1 Tax=Lyophyllum shimeji TaxID=47721 RepID=A0A9P3URH6_LYOSH|nr:hypothetical protein LshimejAT787_0800970 [Lyophyllum shimeji]